MFKSTTKTNKELNLANLLSFLRLLMAFVIPYFILNGNILLSATLFIIALLTDLADGYLAREYGWITKLGTHLDRWADKILFIMVLFTILYKESYYNWIYIFLILMLIFLICGFLAIKKEFPVLTIGRILGVLESIILFFMILGFVNQTIIIGFLLLLIIQGSLYLPPIFLKKKL
ncbi:CDP-alcohol phosphatidyltransferase family protein [Candidatus Woesearchaeota archaeon]|nr:CDP-alcohol phosphatidyltransferase family protein [Candidatus Woesearchaeota archaeon]